MKSSAGAAKFFPDQINFCRDAEQGIFCKTCKSTQSGKKSKVANLLIFHYYNDILIFPAVDQRYGIAKTAQCVDKELRQCVAAICVRNPFCFRYPRNDFRGVLAG